MSLHNLISVTQDAQSFVQAENSVAVDITSSNNQGNGCSSIAFQVSATVSTPGNQAFTAADVDVDEDTITIEDHGFLLGLKVQLTTSGALPTGLSTSTDYFVIVVDADTIKLASSLVNANAGTEIDITNAGSGSSSANPVALAGATATLMKSMDGTNYVAEGSPVNITATAVLAPFEKVDPALKHYRVAYAITAGQLTTVVSVLGKGPV